MKIFSEIKIQTKPEKVFYWLKEPERAKEWMTSVTDAEIIKETPGRVGTTFRETVMDNKGRKVEMTGEMTEYIENEAISFFLNSKYHSVVVRHFLEETQGSTRLTLTAKLNFKSIFRFLSYIMWPLLKKKILDQSRQEFLKLKELCEQKD